MITIKTTQEIEYLRESGKRLSRVLHAVKDIIRPGISTFELDAYAEKLIRDGGDEPAFLGYTPWDAHVPYPASLCVSVNNEVVHGIPKKTKILKEGDIVSIDLGVKHQRMITDMALTVPVGNVSDRVKELLRVTEESLYAGIAASRGGNTVGDIGAAIAPFAKKYKLGLVDILSGHGVGHKVHEDPEVPNEGRSGMGPELRPGMVLALEPIFTLGRGDVLLEDDGYTFTTKDDSLSAHFEHTILITEGEAELLTTHSR